MKRLDAEFDKWKTERDARPAQAVTSDLILDPGDPLPSAREFIARGHSSPDGCRWLHHYNSDFYGWTGSHYATIRDDAIRAALYEFLEPAQHLKTIGENEQLVPFKPTKSKCDNVLDALRAEAHLSVASLPAWIGGATGPDPAECIAVRNGILHVPSMRLHPPSPRFFNVNATDFDYTPAAPSPATWLKFLLDLWPDDEQARDTLQEIMGLLLTLDTRYEKLFLIVGPPRSGKGTIARVLRALVGLSNACGPTLSGLQNQFGLQGLVGKQLAIVSDARLGGKSDQSIIAERLLAISGEDALSVPRKNRTDWEGKLSTRFLLLSNELPRIADASGALASRFIILTMRRSFLGREDHDLTAKLLVELPGIFNWALEGLHRLNERGRFVMPESSTNAVAELEALGSPVGAFVADLCRVEPGRSIEAARLYEGWRAWCEDEGRDHPGTAASFGRDLMAAEQGIVKRRHREFSRQAFYEGIDLI